MKKSKIAYGIAYGAMMGLMLFSLMRPKSERVFLVPDDKGSLSRTITERNYTAEVRELDHRILSIYFKPNRDHWDYLFPVAMGIAIGIAIFRNPPKSRENQLVDADQRIVTEHTLYPNFVREDSDRALFGAPENLVGSWRASGASDGLRDRLVPGPKPPETPPWPSLSGQREALDSRLSGGFPAQSAVLTHPRRLLGKTDSRLRAPLAATH